MSVWKRVRNIFAKHELPQEESSLLTLGPGDVIEVSLETYRVTGKTRNQNRNAVMLTLQDGGRVRYLLIEERERTIYQLYDVIDGRLDSPDEIPTTIEMDDCAYHLEEQFFGRVTAAGQTAFLTSGEQHVWQYQSDDRRLLRIEWQDGRFQLYEGESILPADVQVLRGT